MTVNNTFPPYCGEDAFSGGTADNASLNVPMGYTQAYASASGWNAFDKHDEFSLPVNLGDRFALDGIAYIVTGIEEGGMTVKVTYQKTANDKTESAAIADANKEGYTGVVNVPATISYQGKEFIVDEIDEKAFYGASEMTSVSLPLGIAVIPQYTFQDCTSLASVSLPATVTELGSNVFAYCESLAEIVLPEGLESIGNRCFQNSGITNINIPSALTSLPDYCFYGCSLESVKISDQISKIGSNCFQNCKKLTSVVLPSGIESLPASVFSNCSSLQSINIPESVTSIGSSAFANCSSLDNIMLPSSLKALSNGMLQNCSSLKEVVIPAGITSLQNLIFSGCSSLEKVTMSRDITAISQSAFANCQNLHTIAYHGDSEETVPGVIKLGDKTLSIGQYAFQNCRSITEIILPDGFTTIGGREPFKKTGISQLVIPASVTSMNQNYICGDNDSVTFYMCSTT
ncbi:MAG: leucine-rich repeat domain-containing protein, partial [Muribaculaceae bacterium]|nr:leucine-rich repeat domain-containing protein [Muribaculaceae bacterium]